MVEAVLIRVASLGGFKYFYVHPYYREDFPFDDHIFFKWVGEKPPTSSN